ncbi:hypothetical protein K7432_000611 [Basidiobolus ranarum]|uniref:Uncharacterized protein n=1 Tax=Basidiobolus ranarum TaxID=34480 RepID=A0ABR2X4S2_9FUNG
MFSSTAATAAATGAAALGVGLYFTQNQNSPNNNRRPSLGSYQFFSILSNGGKPDPYAEHKWKRHYGANYSHKSQPGQLSRRGSQQES